MPEDSPQDNEQRGPERSIRVFISSTFRDMHSEREELVKRVFPRLRKLCEDRGVGWCEVDLRWGVTQEQKGEVLNICLAEIDRCRPFFIGLLGERYGWVPEGLEPAALEREPWLAERTGLSITELEILHGVLNNPGMAGRALFYFRDPKYAERLGPGADRADFLAESPGAARRLAELKARIRASGSPVREPYADARELGELVLADMNRIIEELYPRGDRPGELDRELAEHEAYLRSRLKVFVGRRAHLDAIDLHMDDADSPLVLLGESGIGKSAILANWISRRRRARPGEFILAHFAGSTPSSTDWKALARRVIGELGRRFGFKLDAPDGPVALRQVLARALHMASAKGRCVLVLDGLDQLEDRDQAPDLVWLPRQPPENIRLVASARAGRALAEMSRRGWMGLPVEPLGAQERVQVIIEHLAQYRKALSPAQAQRIASAGQSGNPLFLRALLEELRVFGVHEKLDERIGHYLEAPDAENLYVRILARLETDYDRDRPGLVRDAFSLLWAARRGLSEGELLDQLGSKGSLPRAVWSPLYLAAEESLVVRSGLIGFFHDYLRRAVQARYLPGQQDQRSARLRLAEYFSKRDLGPRQVEELPWLLAEAGQWPRLATLLTRPAFFARAWQAASQEVSAFWARIEASSPLRMVEAYRPILESPHQHPGLASPLGHLMRNAGHNKEAGDLWRFLAEEARSSGDLSGLRAHLINLAVLTQEQGDVKRCFALLMEQMAVPMTQPGDLDTLLGNFSVMASIFLRSGQWDGAMNLLKMLEESFRNMGNQQGLDACLQNQAGLLRRRGDLDGAMPLLKEIERRCRDAGDLEGLAKSLGGQADIIGLRGDLGAALVLHREEERIFRRLGNAAGLSVCLGNQALALCRQGDLDGASALLEEKEELCRRMGDHTGLASAFGKKAQVLILKRDYAAAMTLLKEQEKLCREAVDQVGLSESLGNQAIILHERGESEPALTLLKEQEGLLRKSGPPDQLYRNLGVQALIRMSQKAFPEALALAQEEESICRELGDEGGIRAAREQQDLIREVQADSGRSQAARETPAPGLQEKAAELLERGDAQGALALYQEIEASARGSHDALALLMSLANQALLLSRQMGRPEEALRVASEAFRLAAGNGQKQVAQDMRRLVESLKAR